MSSFSSTYKKLLVVLLGMSMQGRAMEEREQPAKGINEQFAQALAECGCTFSEEKLRVAQELLDQGADIEGGYEDGSFISVAIQALLVNGNLLPLMLLLENGADINVRSKSCRRLLEIILNNLPSTEETKEGLTVYGKTYSQGDWRKWDRAEIKPDWLKDWTAAPCGPFNNVPSWEHQSIKQRITTVRMELEGWLLGRGARVNQPGGESTISYFSKLYLQTKSLHYSHIERILEWLFLHGAVAEESVVKEALAKMYPTAVYSAVFFNREDALSQLNEVYQKYADQPVLQSTIVTSLLRLACGRGHVRIVTFMLNTMPHIFHQVDTLEALHLAATNGYVAVVKELLENIDTASKECVGCINHTLLHAVAQNRAEIVTYIFEIAAGNGLYFSPAIIYRTILIAAQEGHLEIFAWLFELFIAPSLRDKPITDQDQQFVTILLSQVKQALMLAAFRKHIPLVTYIVNQLKALSRESDIRVVKDRISNLLRNPSVANSQRRASYEIVQAILNDCDHGTKEV